MFNGVSELWLHVLSLPGTDLCLDDQTLMKRATITHRIVFFSILTLGIPPQTKN